MRNTQQQQQQQQQILDFTVKKIKKNLLIIVAKPNSPSLQPIIFDLSCVEKII
jgi:hypothetical protein